MRHAISQSLYYALGIFLMKGISLFMMPFVTRFLSPDAYGRLDVLVNFLNIGSLLVGLGLTDALFRFAGNSVDNAEHKRVASTALVLGVLIAALSAMVMLTGLECLVGWLPGQVREEELRLAIATLALGGAVNIPLAWLRMRGKAPEFFLVSTLKAAIQAATTLFLLWRGAGVEGVLWSGFLSQAGMTVYLLLRQRRETPLQLDAPLARQLVMYGIPLALAGLLSFMVSGAERWILAGKSGEAALAQYAIAIQFAAIVPLLVEPFSLWFFPRRFVLMQQPQGVVDCARYATLGSVLLLVAVLVVLLGAPIVVLGLMAPVYAKSLEYLPVLALGVAFRQASHFMNLGCYVGRSSWMATALNALLALLAMALYFALIDWRGIWGAVMATLMLGVIRWTLFLVVSQQLLRLDYRYGVLALGGLPVCASLLITDNLVLSFLLNGVTLIWVLVLALRLLPKGTRLILQEKLQYGRLSWQR